MGSVVRRMRRRKRSLGEVRVLRREDYQGLELNAKVELIRMHDDAARGSPGDPGAAVTVAGRQSVVRVPRPAAVGRPWGLVVTKEEEGASDVEYELKIVTDSKGVAAWGLHVRESQ